LHLKTKTKLILLFIIFFTIIVFVFSISIYYLMRKELYSSLDNKLLSISQLSAESPFLIYNQNLPSNIKNLYSNSDMQRSGSILRILDTSGNIGSDLTNLNVKDFPVKKDVLKKALDGIMVFQNYNIEGLKYPIRILTYPVISDGYILGIIQVGTSLEFVMESLKKLIIVLSSLLPILIGITFIFGYYIIDSVLLPIRVITSKAKQISAENLNEKIGGNFPDDEIGELAATFDSMIKRLKESFDSLNQFSADVSHELRTPLTILQGEVEIALRGDRSSNEYRDILKSSLEEIKRLQNIVETLLFLSKAEAGKIVYNKKDIEVLELIVSVIYPLKSYLKERNITLDIDVEPSLIMKGDENLLKQLFYNLIHNAIKYNRDNGKIFIKASSSGKFINVSIEDTGSGIKKDFLEKIFDRFYRVDKSRTRDEGGFGLGLNIAKKIIDIHTAKIDIQSEVEKGTKFIISFPL